MGLIKWDFLRVISCCLTQLFRYITNNKEADNDWFRLESNKEGTRWFGKCWHYHNQLKYEFDVEFDVPVTYPMTSPEIALPELDGKTAKVWMMMMRTKSVLISDISLFRCTEAGKYA